MQVLISIQQQTRESSLFRNFDKLIETSLAFLARQSETLDPEVRDRTMSMISYYVSQMASISGDTVYQRLEEVGTSDEFM